MNLIELKPSKKTLLETLWYSVSILFILGFSQSTFAQKPFHQQVNERITYLKSKRIDVSSRSLAAASGLHVEVVKNIRLGEVEIVDEKVLDAFCDELICSFEIYILDDKRHINLVPKEERKVKVYSKKTGLILYTKS